MPKVGGGGAQNVLGYFLCSSLNFSNIEERWAQNISTLQKGGSKMFCRLERVNKDISCLGLGFTTSYSSNSVQFFLNTID